MNKVLVAYFSAEGTTAKLANDLADAIGADLFQIAPAVPYAKVDLDWTDPKSRSTVEMNDPSSRPAIKALLDISNYDTVFLGFPIWWYREPAIIDTFIESSDFSGKTVVPFATSGISDIGDSGKNIQKLAPEAEVDTGKRFEASTDGDTLAAWAQKWL